MYYNIIEIHTDTIGDIRGWGFSVYFGGRKYPNITSGVYTTKAKAMAAYHLYTKTGKIEFYGDAE